MDHSSEKTSADIQREIDADRQRIGDRIGAIQERMSPGQLIDEVLVYAKDSGTGEFVGSLGNALKANPIPVALIGVSLAWLMAKQGGSNSSLAMPYNSADDRYPLYSAHGAVRRVGPPEEIDGLRYSHFTDDTGQRLKALTDEAGHRAGNFIDATGKAYRGFADATGAQISQIKDEAGAVLDASSGWASETWSQVKDTAGSLAGRLSDAASSISGSTSMASTTLRDQSTRLNDAVLTHFRDQPLVGGALAFAVGAAIGASLPHTDKEDEVFGDAADAVKTDIASQAIDLVDQGKEMASDAFDRAVSVASDVHDEAKERIIQAVDGLKERSASE